MLGTTCVNYTLPIVPSLRAITLYACRPYSLRKNVHISRETPKMLCPKGGQVHLRHDASLSRIPQMEKGKGTFTKNNHLRKSLLRVKPHRNKWKIYEKYTPTLRLSGRRRPP